VTVTAGGSAGGSFRAAAEPLSQVIRVDERDTATVELTRSEASAVIDALSSYQANETGRAGSRALNLEEFLQREFGFKGPDFDADAAVVEAVADVFEDDDQERAVRFSRAEAADVVAALDEYGGASSDEAERVRDLRDRFGETFGGETDSRT
jgi:hypothetical protein